MAGDVQVAYPTSGVHLFFIIVPANSGGMAWQALTNVNVHPGSFENVASGAFFGTYGLPTTDSGGMSGYGLYYAMEFPQGIPPGVYNIAVYDRTINGISGTTKMYSVVAQAWGQIHWGGGGSGSRHVIGQSWILTSGMFANSLPVQISRSRMIENFPIYMRGNTDGITPFTSGIISGQIARDGGLFSPLQSGLITEKGNGFYNVMALTSGDLNGNTIRLLFTGRGISGGGVARPLAYTFVTQGNHSG